MMLHLHTPHDATPLYGPTPLMDLQPEEYLLWY
jgi:hypothetical protein